MASSMVVHRYAQALLEESSSNMLNDVKLIQGAINQSDDLKRLLKSPVVPRHKKSNILKNLFTEHIDATTLRFVHMLVQRGRESLLVEILERFQELSDKKQRMVSVNVRVPSKLSDDKRLRLENALSDQLKRQIRLNEIIDASLIGGILLEIDDLVYDASVRHQLSLLQSSLLTRINQRINL